MQKSAGPTARNHRHVQDDLDINPLVGDVNVSSRDFNDGFSRARRRSNAVPDLKEKEKLSQWGWFTCLSIHKQQAYINIDPNYPVEEKNSEPLDISNFDDDAPTVNELEDSPYPEVRIAVKNYDEDVPANTIRAWTIGLLLVIVGASMNTLFSLRSPSIGLGALIAQIIAWPLGHGWARVMPKRQFNTFGLKWSLNPSPFNIKEHSVIVVMASVSFSAAYATDILVAQIAFYKQDFGLVFQILLVVSTQSIGYGIAGVLRKYLVQVLPPHFLPCLYTHTHSSYPAAMIWPANLVSVTLMNAMYEQNQKPDPTIFGGSIHRYKWFGCVTAGAFLWYFIPGFLAQFLSVFAFATWIAPDNVIVNQLFGGTTGLSLIPLTFDWTQISGFVGSPMIPP
ncbi:hypothetical protein NHQ30_010384 [Ciborinia camelliae]|nr:hypothetical protein NHQ30_010384 [Ciborinia camelliae]